MHRHPYPPFLSRLRPGSRPGFHSDAPVSFPPATPNYLTVNGGADRLTVNGGNPLVVS